MPLINPHTGELGHFWSIGGRECLWCGKNRTAEEVDLWKLRCEPWEKCDRGDE